MNNKATHTTIFIIATVLFLIGLARMPYGYYTFLRLAVCAMAVYNAVLYVKSSRRVNPAVVVFGVLALFYNPIIPVWLGDKGIWTIVNAITAIIFLIPIFMPAHGDE